jgi:hypothetical protein
MERVDPSAACTEGSRDFAEAFKRPEIPNSPVFLVTERVKMRGETEKANPTLNVIRQIASTRRNKQTTDLLGRILIEQVKMSE